MLGLRARYGVGSLGLFGSVARGQDDPEADVDVLVRFEPEAVVTLVTLSRLRDELQSLLGVEVDLIEDHPRLRPGFRAEVEKDLILVA
ncbi:MAG: hypothetical protein EA378_09305 [Phycisphaerales bacterium]|nr:MAG: hypothetical protein EA378_09305 [Phycisphaerales bacterium]